MTRQPSTDYRSVLLLFAIVAAVVKELTALMERHVREDRSARGPKQKNDVNVIWDKRGR